MPRALWRSILLACLLLGPAPLALAQGAWQSQDIGNTVPGSTDITNGVFTIRGNGADIYGSQDAFRFVYVLADGDCEIQARVVAQEPLNDWSKAGVMIRQNPDAGSPHIHINRNPNPSHGIEWQVRPTPNGATNTQSAADVNTLPVWLRARREGNTFTTYFAPDVSGRPGAWTLHGPSTQVSMTNPVHVGLSVLSHVQGTLGSATFDNVVTSGTRRAGAGIVVSRAATARPAPSPAARVLASFLRPAWRSAAAIAPPLSPMATRPRPGA